MATITHLDRNCAIELSERQPQKAGSSSSRSTSDSRGNDGSDAASAASPEQRVVPNYFTSSLSKGKHAAQKMLQEPMLLTKTGLTVEKGEASSKDQVSNKVIGEALAIYISSSEPPVPGSDWHGVIDPISLEAPQLAVQVVSSYRNRSSQTDYQEAHVYEMQSLVSWFASASKSPMSRGDIIFPIRIAANIAVSDLVRANLQQPKAPLTAAEQKAFTAYCEDVSNFINHAKGQSASHILASRTRSTKVAVPLLMASGISATIALQFFKKFYVSKQVVPQAPVAGDFEVSCSYNDASRNSASKTWTISGCGWGPDWCDYLAIPDECVWDGSDLWNKRDLTFSASAAANTTSIYDLCLTQQNACDVATGRHDAVLSKIGRVEQGFNGASALTFLMATAAAALIWRFGVKKAPQLRNFSIGSDAV